MTQPHIQGDDELISNITHLVSEVEEHVRDTAHDEELSELLSVEQFQNYIKWEAANMLQTLYAENLIPRNKVQLVTDFVTHVFNSLIDFLKINLKTKRFGT